MTDYSKITALYSRLSVGDEDRDGGESNSIQNQKIFLENYARGQHLTNIRHYIDDDESGRFFDRSAYSRMMDDVENGKIGVCIMKDLTRWGRDYLQVGNAMEIFRRNNVRFIAINNGIDSEKPDTLEFAPFINIMSEWYAKDISKKVKTGIKTKGMSGKPIVTEAPYGYHQSLCARAGPSGQSVSKLLLVKFLLFRGFCQLRRLFFFPVIQQGHNLFFHFGGSDLLAKILFQFRTIDDHLVYLLFLL